MACSDYYKDPAIQKEIDELRDKINQLEQLGRNRQTPGSCKGGLECRFPIGGVFPRCERCGRLAGAVTIFCKGGVE